MAASCIASPVPVLLQSSWPRPGNPSLPEAMAHAHKEQGYACCTEPAKGSTVCRGHLEPPQAFSVGREVRVLHPLSKHLLSPSMCQPVLGAGLQDEQKELFVTAGCWAVFQVMGCNSEHSQEGHALHGTYLPSRGTQANHLSCDTRSGCTRRQKENKGQETRVPQEWSVKAFLRKCDLNQTTKLPWGRYKGPVAAQSFAGLKNIKRLKQSGLASKQQRRRLEGRSR